MKNRNKKSSSGGVTSCRQKVLAPKRKEREEREARIQTQENGVFKTKGMKIEYPKITSCIKRKYSSV